MEKFELAYLLLVWHGSMSCIEMFHLYHVQLVHKYPSVPWYSVGDTDKTVSDTH